MAEVPDFSHNTFLSHDVVKDILEIARNRDPAIARVDNKFATDLPKISGTPSPLNKRQKVDQPDGHEGNVKLESNTHVKDKPQSDCDKNKSLMPRNGNDDAPDDDDDDDVEQSQQNMVVLPVDPPFKNVLTNDTLLSVGHVYPRTKDNEKEVLLSKPQGESSFFMNGKALTLESTLFPYLFPVSGVLTFLRFLTCLGRYSILNNTIGARTYRFLHRCADKVILPHVKSPQDSKKYSRSYFRKRTRKT